MKDDELQVLSQTYQTARALVVAKEQALQSVLNWGAVLLGGATALVLGAERVSGGAVAWPPLLGWVVLVLVSAATAYQYAGESANLARLGAYAHRIEEAMRGAAGSKRVPLYEHWSKDTQHWIQVQFSFSAAGWALLVIALQAAPFWGDSAREVPLWPLYWAAGVLFSLVVPGLLGWHSSVQYDRAVAATSWVEAAAAKKARKQ